MPATVQNPPTRLSEYMEAICSLPGWGAERIAGFPSAEFINILHYMHMHYALRALGPQPQPNVKMPVIVVPNAHHFAANGGRAISLLLRAVGDLGRYGFLIPVRGRYDIKKVPKTLLQLPPQQVVVDTFEHVATKYADGHFGAAVMALPRTPDVLPDFLEVARTMTVASRMIISVADRVDAVVMGEVMTRLGYRVAGPVVLEDDLGVPESAALGVMPAWFSVDAVADESSIAGVDSETETLLNGLLRYWNEIHNETHPECTRVFNTQVCGKPFAMDVDGTHQDGVFTRGDFGICRQSCRLVVAPSTRAEGLTYFPRIPPLPEDLVAKLPAAGDALYLLPDERILEWVEWLGLFDQVLRSEPYYSTFVALAKELRGSGVSDSSGCAQAVDAPDVSVVAEVQPKAPALTPPEAPPTRTSQLHLKLSQGAGTVNVAAFAASLAGKGDDRYAQTIQHVRAWIKRHGFEVDADRSSFAVESDSGEVSIETDGRALWAMRYDDRRAMSTGATWRVEITVIREPLPAIGLRLSQIRSKSCTSSPAASGMPAVIRTIAADSGLEDSGYPLRCGVQDLRGGKGGEALVDMLLSPGRAQPVLVVGADVDESATRLAERIVGLGHVVRIDRAALDRMIARVGKERSTLGRAVRLYRPGFTASGDPLEHPVWRLSGNQIPKWLADAIFEDVAAASVAQDLDERVPSFQDVREILAERRRDEAARQVDALRERFESGLSIKDVQIQEIAADRAALRGKLAEAMELVDALKARNDALEADLKTARRDVKAIKDELRQAQYQITAQWSPEGTVDSPDGDAVEGYYPDTWDDLEEWVESFGMGRILLMPGVQKRAMESGFRNIPLAYMALEYLARYYVPMRLRRPDDPKPKEESDAALNRLGLDLSRVGVALDDHRYAEDYTRVYKGRRYTFDMHLKSGVGFDPATLFRLYFCYDKEQEVVLVGSMPGHLTNRLTHAG